jgi:hypothetical protein
MRMDYEDDNSVARSDVTCAGKKAALLSKTRTQLAGVGIVFVGNPEGGLQVCQLVQQNRVQKKRAAT